MRRKDGEREMLLQKSLNGEPVILLLVYRRRKKEEREEDHDGL
jgi:hypothetical protein